MNTVLRALFFPFVIVTLISCGGGGGGGATQDPSSPAPTAEPLPDGATVYMEPVEGGNSFSCVRCHAISEPMDSFTRPGHPIGDAPRRPHFKNGLLPNFVDAVNVCLDVWMNVPTPWTEETPEFQALEGFLNERDGGTGEADPLVFAKAEPIVFDENNDLDGDAEAGRTTFNESCAICHGENAVGTDTLAPRLAGRLGYEGAPDYISRKVRLSGPTNHEIYQGEAEFGRMPFWAIDRISDIELENIITYLVSSTFDDGETPDDDQPAPVSDCASTHPKIGQVAELSTRSHGVSGTAMIVDDCTIRIDNFNFDGGGINVRVYAGESSFRNGFEMGNNLVNNTGYENETLTVTLPEGMTMDDLDRVSIWCVPVGISFGDGIFQ